MAHWFAHPFCFVSDSKQPGFGVSGTLGFKGMGPAKRSFRRENSGESEILVKGITFAVLVISILCCSFRGSKGAVIV